MIKPEIIQKEDGFYLRLGEHTPKPWVKDYNGTIGHIKTTHYLSQKRSPTVCKYRDEIIETICKFSEEEMEANGNLIAAAPDLLEACKELLDMITDNRLHGPEVYKAAQAIAKAEGRGGEI